MRFHPTWRIRSFGLLLLSMTALVVQQTQAAESKKPVKEFVAQVQKVYEGTTTLKAHFDQTITSTLGKRKASGTVYLKKPGKMRWEYEKPKKKLFVADGTTLWKDEPDEEDRIIFKQPLKSSDLPAQVRFLFGQGKLEDDFDISYLNDSTVGQPDHVMLKLVPKKTGNNYKYLVFGIDPATFAVKETLLYDVQNGSNHFVFTQIETNTPQGLEDRLFQFTPPPNVKVIDPSGSAQ